MQVLFPYQHESKPLNHVTLLPAVWQFPASFMLHFFPPKNNMTGNTNGLISRCTTPPASLTINAMLLMNYPLSEPLAEVGLARNGH